MSFVAVGIAGAAIVGGAIASNQAAQAQKGIAGAQLRQQQADRALALANAESPQELAQLQQSVDLNNQDIARKQKILDSTDPAIIEAGQQALKLLRGEDSAALNPLNNQISKARAQLEERLKSQLGSGYANTTAGIQALAAFDQQANDSRTSAQQSSIAQLLGVTAPFSANGLQANIGNAGSIANLYGNTAQRKISAINGTPITAAGSQFAGQLAQAQGWQNTIGQVSSLAGLYAGVSAGNASTTNNTGMGLTADGSYTNTNFTGATGYLK